MAEMLGTTTRPWRADRSSLHGRSRPGSWPTSCGGRGRSGAQRNESVTTRRPRRVDALQRRTDLRRRRSVRGHGRRSSRTSPSSARSQEQLRYNEARLTTLFEVSSDIMAILEPDGHMAREPGRDPHPRLPDRLGSRGRHPLAGPSRRPRARRTLRSGEVLAGTRGKHEPARAPTPPHRRPLPLVRLHRREPDRQPDGARPHHHRPRRDRAEDRRGRAGRGRDPVPSRVRTLAARHRARSRSRATSSTRTPRSPRWPDGPRRSSIGANLELLIHPDDRERLVEEAARRVIGESDVAARAGAACCTPTGASSGRWSTSRSSPAPTGPPSTRSCSPPTSPSARSSRSGSSTRPSTIR